MAVTTRKGFKEQVQNYIMDRLSMDEHEELAFQLNAVVEGFKNWYGLYEQKRTPNRQEAFIEWLKGLPSELNVDYMNDVIVETYRSWFKAIGESQKKMKEEKEIEWFYYLIFREFQTLCKKEGVKFY